MEIQNGNDFIIFIFWARLVFFLQIRAANLSGDCAFKSEAARFNFGFKQHQQVPARGKLSFPPAIGIVWGSSSSPHLTRPRLSLFRTGVRQRAGPPLHPSCEEHQPRGGGEDRGRGVWHVLQGPRSVWKDPAQQEGCSVCLQRLRE